MISITLSLTNLTPISSKKYETTSIAYTRIRQFLSSDNSYKAGRID